jgi:hypothetical protein
VAPGRSDLECAMAAQRPTSSVGTPTMRASSRARALTWTTRRLRVHHAVLGWGFLPNLGRKARSDRQVRPLPRSVDAPSPEPPVVGLPGRKVSGQHPYGTSAFVEEHVSPNTPIRRR